MNYLEIVEAEFHRQLTKLSFSQVRDEKALRRLIKEVWWQSGGHEIGEDLYQAALREIASSRNFRAKNK